MTDIEKLCKLIKALNASPQTVEGELHLALLECELAIANAKEQIAISELVALFLNAYKKTGTFTAIRSDGTRLKSSPYKTGRGIQDFWNVRSEAYRLANWNYKCRN